MLATYYPQFAHFLSNPLAKPNAKALVFTNFTWANWLVRWCHKERANGWLLLITHDTVIDKQIFLQLASTLYIYID